MENEKKEVWDKTECNDFLLPIRDSLAIFSGKWKIPIISALLYVGESGFKELERMVMDITPKMLSKELKELETNLMVERIVLDTRPVKVKYRITEYGKSSELVIEALLQWGRKHREKIMSEEVKSPV
ncbi:MAG: helix-turn-helix domain-containing protein [Bacteroidia bacterium]|nr:helix-turn-helix domain-containing protein [Bacteroidia bacterium]